MIYRYTYEYILHLTNLSFSRVTAMQTVELQKRAIRRMSTHRSTLLTSMLQKDMQDNSEFNLHIKNKHVQVTLPKCLLLL